MDVKLSKYKIGEIMSANIRTFDNLFEDGTKLVVNLNSVLSTLLDDGVENELSLMEESEVKAFGTYVLTTVKDFIIKCVKSHIAPVIICMTDFNNTLINNYYRDWYPKFTRAYIDKPIGYSLFRVIVDNLARIHKRSKNFIWIDSKKVEPYVVVNKIAGSIVYITREEIAYTLLNHKDITIIKNGVYGDRIEADTISKKFGIDISIIHIFLMLKGISQRGWQGKVGFGKVKAKRYIQDNFGDILSGEDPILKELNKEFGANIELIKPDVYFNSITEDERTELLESLK